MDYQSTAVAAFMAKAYQEVPPTPTIPNLDVRKLRARLILEEALETINKGLGLEVRVGIAEPVSIGSITFWANSVPDLVELADGCADLKVVTVGTELAFGIDGEPVFNEVHRSNMSKFIDGFRREDGKWQKGPSYSPANISPIIESQKSK